MSLIPEMSNLPSLLAEVIRLCRGLIRWSSLKSVFGTSKDPAAGTGFATSSPSYLGAARRAAFALAIVSRRAADDLRAGFVLVLVEIGSVALLFCCGVLALLVRLAVLVGFFAGSKARGFGSRGRLDGEIGVEVGKGG